jgi:hypothetical protein
MRIFAKGLTLFLACATLVLLSISLAHAEELFTGRAAAVLVRPLLGNSMNSFVDTGELPLSGGRLEVTALELQIGDYVYVSNDVLSTTRGGDRAASSSSAQFDVTALTQFPIVLTASEIRSEADASCDGVSGSATVTDLRIGGQAIAVTGAPNQKVVIGNATIILNEQIVDLRQRSITVNAVHVMLATGTEVILSSARAGVSCIVATEPKLWQDVKSLYR